MPLPFIVHHPIYRQAAPARRTSRGNKYAALWERWQAAGLQDQIVEIPEAAPVWWLKLAHDADYVDRVLDGSLSAAERRRIGLELSETFIERLRYSNAGTVYTGELALKHGLALHGAGGSHHALSDAGAGYCVFNDVAVAARTLQAKGLAQTFLVIDLDVHQGDGTAEIFRGDISVFTFSMHCEKNFPARKQQSDVDVPLPVNTSDVSYLRTLDAHLTPLLDRLSPDLIFYNAGVDPHDEDRLGKLSLSDDGIKARDIRIIKACRDRGFPLATVLGGGYGDDAEVIADRHMHLFHAAQNYAIGSSNPI